MSRAIIKNIIFCFLVYWCFSIFPGSGGTISWAEREVYYHLSLEELLEVSERKIEEIDRRMQEEEARRIKEERAEQAQDRADRAKILIEQGHFEEAREEIQKAEMLAQDRSFRSELRRLERRLDREERKRTRDN